MPDQQNGRRKKTVPPTIDHEPEKTPKDIELEQLRAEVKQLREGWAAIAPGLQRINDLVAAGWIKPNANGKLIETVIDEITLLRAERLVPPLNPTLTETIMTAFGVMADRLRLSLHMTEKSVQQLRYDAFQAGVETLLPVLLSKGRLEGYALVQGILFQDIADSTRVLGYLKEPPHADPAVAEARSRNAEKLEAQVSTMQHFQNLIGQIISGGMTPDQAIERANAERARRAELAGVPPGTIVN